MINPDYTHCAKCENCQPDRYKLIEGKMIITGWGCGNYGFNRSFTKGFLPRKKRCKHFDERIQ